jgi:hypothetical protein
MKKMLLMLSFALISLISYAPNNNILIISREMFTSPVIRTIGNYELLIKAIRVWETRGIPEPLKNSAYNKLEKATGGLQIRPCRLKHYNTLTKKNYTLQDMYDFNKAKEVFMYFTCHDGRGRKIPYKSWEKAAKDWNGGGPKTLDYWKGVLKLLNT